MSFTVLVNAQDNKENFRVHKIDRNFVPPPIQTDAVTLGNSGFFMYDQLGMDGSIDVTADTGISPSGTSYRFRLTDNGTPQYYPFVAVGKTLSQTYGRPTSVAFDYLIPPGYALLRNAEAFAMIGDTLWNTTGLATISSNSAWQTLTLPVTANGGPTFNQFYIALHSGSPGGNSLQFLIYISNIRVLINNVWIVIDPGTGTLNIPPLATGLQPPTGFIFYISPQCLSWNSISGIKYWLQVSTDPNFTNLVVNNQNVTSQFCMTLVNGYYWWRLRNAYTQYNAWGGWTQVRNFGVQYFVGVNPSGNEIPKEFALYQNYPNPFNPSTLIKFDLPNTGATKIDVLDITGKLVKNLVNEEMAAGSYTVDFDGSELSSGVYFYRIAAGNFTATKKMVLVK